MSICLPICKYNNTYNDYWQLLLIFILITDTSVSFTLLANRCLATIFSKTLHAGVISNLNFKFFYSYYMMTFILLRIDVQSLKMQISNLLLTKKIGNKGK